jgi:carbon monoxide dehydrogenase subunit G
MDTLITKKEYSINASKERTWDLLGMMVFDSMSMENMKVLDERNFKAELKVKAYGISMKMHLRGEMTDVVIPEKLTVKLAAKGVGNMITLVQRITMSLKEVDKEKTTMSCEAYGENLNFLFKYILLGQVKSMASRIFDSIEQGIKQVA